MPDFKHLLITRFNLRRDDWSTNKNNLPVLTEEWHKNRFTLFTNFCFSSVKAQTSKNFDWLVFFDTATPEKYLGLIKNLENEFPLFKPIFIDGMSNLLLSLKRYITNLNCDYIITSGLDNDDCISKNHIEEIQKRFNYQDFLALDFVDGYTVQLQNKIKIGYKLHAFNPFISLIEKKINPVTVCNAPHRMWKREKRIEQIKNVRTWASIIHHENKVNEFTGYGSVNPDIFFENFIISEDERNYIKKGVIPMGKWPLRNFFNAINSLWTFRLKTIKKSIGLYNK